MTIRAVLFDLDGTLLDRRATFRLHIELMIERHPEIFRDQATDSRVGELVTLDSNGSAARAEFYQSVERHLGLASGASSILLQHFERHFPESCVPMPHVTDTLDALRERGVKVGLITNGRALMQNRKIDGLGIRPLLDSVVISGDLGVRKPDPRIFAAALEDLAVDPSSAAYVGDNPEPDITGAKRSGMFAVWRRDEWWPEPEEADLVIDDLSQLIPGLFESSAVEPVEDIEFIDPGRLVDGDLELRLVGTTPADHDRGFAPAYRFEMIGATSSAVMGGINLRVGHTEHLRLYRGHIGFGVLEPFRGNHLALRSCRLLGGLALYHSLLPVWLTCDEGNVASQRTLEALGAEFVETRQMPIDYPYIVHYLPGTRTKRRYRWMPTTGAASLGLQPRATGEKMSCDG